MKNKDIILISRLFKDKKACQESEMPDYHLTKSKSTNKLIIENNFSSLFTCVS